MHKRTTLCTRLFVTFGGFGALLAGEALAQQAAPAAERVEITGSAIKRIDAETSVPVTVLKIEELRDQGLATVEQVLSAVTAMQTSVGTSQVVGVGTGGASFADLRGIGPNKTLVLLNGRRVANNAISSAGVDLNTIPFAALERVEVLRDGASALYGTDAIGGVINFITRNDWRGGVVTLGADAPQHPGGKSYNANVGYGFGDLSKDKFNIFAFIDAQHQDAIRGSQRPFGVTGKTTTTTFPGTYSQGDFSVTPGAPNCASPFLVPGDATTCAYNTNLWVDYVPQSDRVSGMLKGTLQFSPDHRLNLEYFGAKTKVIASIAPVPYGGLTVNPGTPFFPGNGITPAPPAGGAFDPTQPVSVRYRDVPSGGRRGQSDNSQQRFLAALEGSLAGWDYRTGVSYNENKLDDKVTGGYTDGDIVAQGVLDGTINPFGNQTAAGAALLQSAVVNGTLQSASGYVTTADASASRELGDWFGSGLPSAIALGVEFRREKFSNVANVPIAEKVGASTGVDPATHNEGERDIKAFYAELNMRPLRSLELTAAVRYDKYSDFGNTTNPKVGFRFQPIGQFLLRGSYSTGFRAPSLYELNSAQAFTFTGNPLDDPARCPGGKPIPGVTATDNCNVQFLSLLGGNKTLKPEKARNATVGLVLQPTEAASIGLDFWWIWVKNQIGLLADTTVFGDPVKYADLFHRAPDGSLSTDGSQCPGANCGFVSLVTQNLGGVNTSGIDLTATYRLNAGDLGRFAFAINSTYVTSYEYQREPGGVWIQNIGRFPDSLPVFRWQDTLTATWRRGPFSAGWTGHYKSGYSDQNANDEGNQVASNFTMDIYGGWQPTKAWSLILGVRNLLDKDPPFSNQGVTFQQGYDPRYADATGRLFYVRGSYSF